MKTCIKCGADKRLDDFPRHSTTKDGYRNYCKLCKSEMDKIARLKKLSDPVNREKERRRLQKVAEGRSDEQKQAASILASERFANKQRIINDEFFARHGCDKKEYKRRIDEKVFITTYSELNHGKYDYSDVEYVNTKTPVKIYCIEHRRYFNQTPKDHKNGRGCVECGNKATGDKLRKSQSKFIEDAKEVWGSRYLFENVVYTGNATPVQVTCREHGDFPIRPGNFLFGRGCPSCAEHGYNTSKSGSLYLLVADGIVKVGITNRIVKDRVKGIAKSSGIVFRVEQEHRFQDGAIPLAIETTLLRELRSTHAQPTEKFDGSTECFYDVNHDWLLARINELIKEHTECQSSTQHQALEKYA